MLDIPTLIAGQVILTVIFAGIFYALHRLYPELAGLRHMVAAFGIVSVARVLYMADDTSLNGCSLLVANVLAITTSGLLYMGTLRHLGSSKSTRLTWIILGSLTLLYLVLEGLKFRPVIGLGALGIAFLYIRAVWAQALFRLAARRPLLRGFAICMAIYAVFALNVVVRGVPELSVPSSRLLHPLPLEPTFLVGNVVLSALLGIYMLLMVESSILERLKLQSLTDPVTGILNRRGSDAKIVKELAQAARGKQACSVALIDLDYFKSINDKLGHAVGDAALRHVAELIVGAVRPYDVLGRVGGDEFVLVMPSTNGPTGLQVAERICELVRTTEFGGHCCLSLSIGIAQSQPGDTLTSILERADAALYEVKKEGRGCAKLHGFRAQAPWQMEVPSDLPPPQVLAPPTDAGVRI